MKKAKINLTIQNYAEWHGLPPYAILYFWLQRSLMPTIKTADITLRIIKAKESTELNSRFRQQNNPTNILSFCYSDANDIHLTNELIGDLALCPEVFEQEVMTLSRSHAHHLAHLLVHGMLHLQGYDHENDQDAMHMENTEISLLQQMGFANPYLIQD
jgi:probable rRNA maturation factor